MKRYEARKVGQPVPVQQENFVKCFCCRDSALIPAATVKKYLIPDYDDQRFYPEQPDSPVLCTRVGCLANELYIEAHEGSGTVQRLTFRYADWSVDRQIDPRDCSYVHEQELQEFRASVQAPFSVAEAVGSIVGKQAIKSSPWDKVARAVGVEVQS